MPLDVLVSFYNFHIFSLTYASEFSDLYFLVSVLCTQVSSTVYSTDLAVQNFIVKLEPSAKQYICAGSYNIYPYIVDCSLM
jgi:hypothetical protein